MADPQKQADPFAAFGGTAIAPDSAPQQAQTDADPFAKFGGVGQDKPVAKPSPEDQASQTRQMLVSGLTGMPTPNMTDEDKKSFAKGKAAGAISVPIVAGATVGGTEVAAALPSVLTHTVDGVKAITAWAAKNPVPAYLLYQLMRDLIPGARKAIGIVKGVPDTE